MVSLVAGVPSHPRWVLGFKPQSSARTASAISRGGFSPASYTVFKIHKALCKRDYLCYSPYR